MKKTQLAIHQARPNVLRNRYTKDTAQDAMRKFRNDVSGKKFCKGASGCIIEVEFLKNGNMKKSSQKRFLNFKNAEILAGFAPVFKFF